MRKNLVGIEDIKAIMGRTIQELEEMSQDSSGVTGLKTGFVDFDSRTRRLAKININYISSKAWYG